jgi:hypothetical protein
MVLFFQDGDKALMICPKLLDCDEFVRSSNFILDTPLGTYKVRGTN